MSSKQFPTVLEETSDDDSRAIIFIAQKDLCYFDGHFDGAPILAGVVQIHWARHFGCEQFGIHRDFSHMEAIKFRHVITAEQKITLRLRYDEDACRLYFTYDSDVGPHSSGRIVFCR